MATAQMTVPRARLADDGESSDDRHETPPIADLVPETAATAALYATQPRRKTDRDATATPPVESNSEYCPLSRLVLSASLIPCISQAWRQPAAHPTSAPHQPARPSHTPIKSPWNHGAQGA